MVRRLRRRGFDPKTVGADKAYDVGDFPHRLTDLRIKPHLAVNQHRPPGSPARRHARGLGYQVSQRLRKRVEEIFGWMKTVGGLRKTRYRGRARTWSAAYLVAAAYNLLRVSRLTATT